ncbi:oligosaccharide flippase family protein [Halovenus sp. WSH3]|uniref:Oligosaccharide flippase family protein n=1 Tax=Halovenus carboxidivorans TaxID=2692199 RepID=A0A6B0T042_9EURY|nr:flippase [Halovenus carboxidivorans]MXR51175.1 oligosaccharide flippase family protein [Halovenus carboxidivorans]
MRLARETLIHFVGSVGTSIAGFLGTIVIARLLGAEALGIYSLAIALLFWLDLPTTGIQQTIMKRVSEGTDREQYFTVGVLLNACLVAVVGITVLVAEDAVNAYLGADLALFLVVLFAANVTFGTLISGLQAQKRVGVSGLLRGVERFLRTGFQFVLIIASYAVVGLVVGHALSLLVAAAVCLLFYEIGLELPTLDQLRDSLAYAKYAWASSIKGQAYGWLDTIVLGVFVSASLIGIYEVAWSLASTLILVNNSIGQTLFPELSELNEQDDHTTIRQHLEEAMAFSGIVVLPGLVGAAILGTDLLRIYSPEFTEGSLVLLILIVARMANSFGKVFYTSTYALDRPDLAFRIVIPVILTNLILNVVLISQIGWYGAAIATAITGVVNLVLSYAVLRYLLGTITLPSGEIAKQTLASLVMGGAIYILTTVVPTSSVTTVVLVFVGAAIYTVSLIGISGRFRRKLFGVVGSFS